jgi:outer membrane protein, heavy metal efflux system
MFRKHLACIAGVLLIAGSAAALDWNDPHSVIDAALAASPSLREVDAQLAAARARQRGAGATPNPMLMAGVQNQQIDLSTDPMMTMYMVGASQTFIRSDRRDALRHAAATDVERLEREMESRRAEITRDVVVSYTEAAAAENQIAANDETAQLAGTTAEAARIRYETGAAAQIDIIRAKLEQSNVKHEILMRRSMREQALARLRALLNLPPDTEIPPFSLQHAMQHSMSAAKVSLNATTPAIAALEADVTRAQEDVRLAKLTTKPDFNVEAAYGFRPQQKDVFSLVGRIELPVRRATIEPRIAEAVARRDAATAQIEVLRQQIRTDFGVAVAQRNAAIEQINLHVEQLVPEAKLGFESALGSYQSGRTTFDAVLGALQTYRMLNVDYYDFLRQELVAEAEIDALQHGARPAGGAR